MVVIVPVLTEVGARTGRNRWQSEGGGSRPPLHAVAAVM